MAKISNIWMLGLLAATPGWCWDHVQSSQDFLQVIEGGKSVLVAFVAPWTEPSKALEQEWLAASSQSGTPMMSVDCVQLKNVCEDYGVISYPAIRLYQNGADPVRYRGLRTTAELLSFTKRTENDSVSHIDSKNMPQFQSSDDFVFIAFLKSNDQTQTAIFNTVAKKNSHRFSFGIFNDPNRDEYPDLVIPSIVSYEKQSGRRKIFSAAIWGLKEAADFIETSSKPLIREMSRRNELEYLKDSKSLVYIFVQTEKERIVYRQAFAALASSYQEFLSFVTVDALEYPEMVSALGLKSNKVPAVGVQVPSDGRVFPFDQRKEITAANVEVFIMEIVEGKVKPFSNDGIVDSGPGQGEAHDEL